MATINNYLSKVFHGDALTLLRSMPYASVHAVIADPMHGTKNDFSYDWGPDPAQGDPMRHWAYHQPIYDECRRVLKPGGILAWGQNGKFYPHYPGWFGEHRVWTLTRFGVGALMAGSSVWVVQTREQQPVEFPHKDSLVPCKRSLSLKKIHPCRKSVEEMVFMIEALTMPGQIILDCFCGIGSTLVAAQQLGRCWIGCDKSRTYCQTAIKRLETGSEVRNEQQRTRHVAPRKAEIPAK